MIKKSERAKSVSLYLKVFVTATFVLLAPLKFAAAAKLTGGQDGNAGAGVESAGVYRTFHSSGLYIDPTPLTKISGQDLMLKIIDKIVDDPKVRSTLYADLIPNRTRHFFLATTSQFTDEAKQRLTKEYARLMKQRPKDVKLFAITDITKRTTYLLPEFFDLQTEAEKAAALFHEGYWIAKSGSSERDVVAAEIAFQRFAEADLKSQYDDALPNIMSELVGDVSLPVKAAIQHDVEYRTWPGVSEQGVTLTSLLPSPEMMIFRPLPSYQNEFRTLTVGFAYGAYFSQLSRQYPRSQFLRVFADSLLSKKVALVIWVQQPKGWEADYAVRSLISDCFPGLDPVIGKAVTTRYGFYIWPVLQAAY